MSEAGSAREGIVLALYQDTQGSTAVLMDAAGRLLGRSYSMITQQRPQAGWVEYDPYEIWHRSWQAVEQVCKAAGVAKADLVAVGVTTQRGTVAAWERDGGRPIGARTAETCKELRAGGYEELLRQRSGGVPDTTMAGPKIQWLLTNIPGLRRRAEQGEVCCGTMDSWLLWNLTGGATHATDRTNASESLLYSLETGGWDDELLDLFGIPRAMLPQIQSSGYAYGQLTSGKTPVTALCADQQASLFGQACFEPGMVKVTCGRDAVVMMNIGEEPLDTEGQLRTVAAAGLDGESLHLALEGRVLAAGLVIEWLRDEMALIPTAADSEVLAQQARDSSGVYLIPAFLGIGAPHWNAQVRGNIVGLTSTVGRAQLVRAALEGVVYRIRDVTEAMTRWAARELSEAHADGGVAANNFLLQFMADMLGVPVRRNRATHAAGPGVAYLAGLQAGLWASRQEIAELWTEDRRFDPALDERTRRLLYRGWQEAVQRLLSG